jgi:hypothetical protein
MEARLRGKSTGWEKTVWLTLILWRFLQVNSMFLDDALACQTHGNYYTFTTLWVLEGFESFTRFLQINIK